MPIDKRRLIWEGKGQSTHSPPELDILRAIFRGVPNFSGWETVQVGDILDDPGYVAAFTDYQLALEELGGGERSVMFVIGITEGAQVYESGDIMLLARHQLLKVDDTGDISDNPREIAVHTYRSGE